MIDYHQICTQTCHIAKLTGEFIRKESESFSTNTVVEKGLNNFVSYVDKKAEELIVERLYELFPEAGFITEEETITTKRERFMWVIDPLDGTTNFIHGLPPYSVSIGLLEDNIPVMGVVYEVKLDECFYAWKDSPAYLNGKVISVSKTESVKDSLIATGFPYCDYHLLQRYMDCLEYLMKHSHGIRRIGSAAVDLAYVACGRFDAFYEYGLNPWDVTGGAFILQQAGGTVSDFSGGSNYIFGKELVATNNIIFDEFLKIVKNYMI